MLMVRFPMPALWRVCWNRGSLPLYMVLPFQRVVRLLTVLLGVRRCAREGFVATNAGPSIGRSRASCPTFGSPVSGTRRTSVHVGQRGEAGGDGLLRLPRVTERA